MKHVLRFCLMVSVAIVLFSSCKKAGYGDAKYIPKDALMVVSLNLSDLNDTLEKAGFGIDSLFNKMVPKDSAGAAQASKRLNEIKNAGLNWKETLYIFTMQYKTVKGDIAVMNVLGSVSDTAKFTAFVKNSEESDEIVRENGFSYSVMGGGSITAWNKDKVIFSHYQVASNVDSFGIPVPQDMSRFRGDMISEVKKYFTQETSASLADVDAFTDLAKEKTHGYTWMNMQSFTQLPGGMSFPQLSELLKNSYSISTFNFERGKIVSDTKMYFSKAMQSILEKNEMPKADLSLIDRYPSKNINGFYLFALNPNAVSAILKEAQLEALANTALSQAGLQLQDILNAMKGDVAFIISDIGNMPMSRTGEPSFANWLVNITIKDRAALDKILNAGVQRGLIVKQGDYIIPNSPAGAAMPMTQKIKLTATNLIIGSDSTLIEGYLGNNTGGALTASLKKRFDGKAGAGYFNFNTLKLPNMQGGASNPMAMMMGKITMFTGQFNDAVVTLDKYDDGLMKGYSELTFKDNSQNSAVVIVKAVSDLVAMFAGMGGARDMGMDEHFNNADTSEAIPQPAPLAR